MLVAHLWPLALVFGRVNSPLAGPPTHPHIKKSSFSIRTDFTLGIYQPEGQLITFGQLFQRRCIAYIIYLVIITKGKGPDHTNRPAKLSVLRYEKWE